MRPFMFRAVGIVSIDEKGMKALEMAFDLTPMVQPPIPTLPAQVVIDMVPNKEGVFVAAHG